MGHDAVQDALDNDDDDHVALAQVRNTSRLYDERIDDGEFMIGLFRDFSNSLSPLRQIFSHRQHPTSNPPLERAMCLAPTPITRCHHTCRALRPRRVVGRLETAISVPLD